MASHRNYDPRQGQTFWDWLFCRLGWHQWAGGATGVMARARCVRCGKVRT